MNWTWYEVVHLLGGVPKGSNPALLRISTDSRDCGPGDLFIAIKGEFFDGHDFLEEVRARGVAGAIIERDVPAVRDWDCCWRTDSTRAALARLAQARRRQFDPRVVAATFVGRLRSSALSTRRKSARVRASRALRRGLRARIPYW